MKTKTQETSNKKTESLKGPDKPIKILYIEDSPGYVRLVKDMLSENKILKFELISTFRLSYGLTCLKEDCFDVVLLDLNLPDAHYLSALLKIHNSAPNIPVVVLTSNEDHSTITNAIEEGAQYYLIKGNFDSRLLIHAIFYAIERKKNLIDPS